MSDLGSSMIIAAHGMKAQSARLKVVAENIANAESTGQSPGAEPYRRKTITFENVLNKQLGTNVVQVSTLGTDDSEFKKTYDPGHPAADESGYVLKPNVNTMLESMDMREAQRSYEANLSTIDITKTMINRTLDLLR